MVIKEGGTHRCYRGRNVLLYITHRWIRVVSPTFPFAPESFRPLSLLPRVVSPPGRFAHFPVRPWVVSPTTLFAPESFRPLIKFCFWYYYFGLKTGIKLWWFFVITYYKRWKKKNKMSILCRILKRKPSNLRISAAILIYSQYFASVYRMSSCDTEKAHSILFEF